jgi:hypothetical protein
MSNPQSCCMPSPFPLNPQGTGSCAHRLNWRHGICWRSARKKSSWRPCRRLVLRPKRPSPWQMQSSSSLRRRPTACRGRSAAVYHRDGRHTGRLGPRMQAPGSHRNGPVYGGRLLEEAILADELGGAPRVALLSGAHSNLPQVLTLAQQAKANAARAEAQAARPVEG